MGYKIDKFPDRRITISSNLGYKSGSVQKNGVYLDGRTENQLGESNFVQNFGPI